MVMWLVAIGCGDPGPDPQGSSDPGPEDPGSDPSDPDDPSDTDAPPVAGAPTWYQDIAPLMADRCGGCHQAGGVAPFSVATFAETTPWGPAIVASIESGAMPPFYAVESDACDMDIGFLEDITLSDDEKQLVYDWVAADMPEGDAATAVPAPLRPVEALDDVDVELALQEPFTIDGDDDIYQCFRIPLPNTERMYLTGMEVVPGNDLVVHHVIVWSDPDDNSADLVGPDGSYGCSGFPEVFPTEIVGTWTPGSQPMKTPPNTGTPMNVGGSLVLNIHYHPTGTTQEIDATKIRLQWSEEEPEQFASWFLIDTPFGASVQPGPNDQGGPEFRIPANVPDHLETVQMLFTQLLFSADMTVFAITPHMHYLGTDMLVTIDHNEGGAAPQCLVHAPGFRFDFQRDYFYDPATGDLPVIHQGDQVRVNCMYDNSATNPFMPLHLDASGEAAPHDVYWGEETADEMCMAIVGLIVPKEGWSPFSWF